MAFSWKSLFAIRKSPKDQVLSSRRGFKVTGGTNVNEETAMQVSSFYRGVIYISSQIAKLPWKIKDAKNQILDADRIQTLLDLSPNDEMNAMTFRMVMIQNAIIHGNSYAEIERDTLGRPVKLWPIPSKSMEVARRRDTGELYYRVMGGSISVPGGDVYFKPADIYHVKNFHTKDGVLGQGVVAYAADTLGISLGADRMAGNLFSNGGIPSGVLEVPGTLSDEALERIKSSWDENHGGRKTGGLAIFEEGMKYNTISVSPDVMQFLESRKFGVLEIARFLGLPPTKLFDTDAATFNNQENSNLEVATDTLDAWAKNLEMEADIKLLNKRFNGRYSELDLYAIFRGDMETRAKYFSSMMQTGSITPNEIREKEGMSPYPDGDRFYIAVNNFSPSDRIDEIIDAQIAPKGNTTPAPVKQDPPPTDPELVKAATKFLTRV